MAAIGWIVRCRLFPYRFGHFLKAFTVFQTEKPLTTRTITSFRKKTWPGGEPICEGKTRAYSARGGNTLGRDLSSLVLDWRPAAPKRRPADLRRRPPRRLQRARICRLAPCAPSPFACVARAVSWTSPLSDWDAVQRASPGGRDLSAERLQIFQQARKRDCPYSPCHREAPFPCVDNVGVYHLENSVHPTEISRPSIIRLPSGASFKRADPLGKDVECLVPTRRKDYPWAEVVKR